MRLTQWQGPDKPEYVLDIKMRSGEGLALSPQSSGRFERTCHMIRQMLSAAGFA